jgi:hypothetical protein
MFLEYISTILWPFAIKCYEDRLNNLVHRADGHTPYETLASLDAAPINTSNFHTFGRPCYVLDHRLQSGTGKIPEWEPCARMGINVGCLPYHTSNVRLPNTYIHMEATLVTAKRAFSDWKNLNSPCGRFASEVSKAKHQLNYS